MFLVSIKTFSRFDFLSNGAILHGKAPAVRQTALARPQKGTSEEVHVLKGYDFSCAINDPEDGS
jgi:hypothetical protein